MTEVQEIRYADVDFSNYVIVGDVYVKFGGLDPMIGRMWECVYGDDRGEYYLLRVMEEFELRVSVSTLQEIVEGLQILCYESDMCLLLRQGYLEICEIIFVVHISYFMECRISYHAGMDGCFGIQGKIIEEDAELRLTHTICRLKPDFDRKQLHFRNEILQIQPHIGRHFDVVQSNYYLRLRWIHGIQSGLRTTKGQSGFKFEMPITLAFIQWLLARIRVATEDSVSFKYYKNHTGPKLRLVRKNGILSLSSEKDFMKIDMLNVSWLDDVLGDNWHMYPLLDHNATIADVESSIHAFIPEMNSGVEVVLDHEQLSLIFSAKYVSKEIKSVLLHKRTDLITMIKNWKQDLEGLCVYDPEDESYYKIVLVEQNYKDFVAKKSKSKPISCCVAWLLHFGTLEYVEDPDFENHCHINEELRLEHCYPYEIHDVIETCVPVNDQSKYKY